MEAKTLAKVSLPLPASYRGNAVLSSDVSLVLPELGTVLRLGPNAHIGIAVLDAAYTRAEGGTVTAARLLVQVSIWRTRAQVIRITGRYRKEKRLTQSSSQPAGCRLHVSSARAS